MFSGESVVKWRGITDSLKRKCERNQGRKDVLTIVQGIESFYTMQVPEGHLQDAEVNTVSDQIDSILVQAENLVCATKEWKAWRSDCQKINESYEVLKKMIILVVDKTSK